MTGSRTRALPPSSITGIAVAADTDITGETTISYFSGIRVKPIAARLVQATS